MADTTAKIRPYTASDRKLVLFKVGKSNMEALAVANSKTCLHPLALGVWLAFAAAFIQLMNWWPSNDHGFWSYLTPLPAFAATAVPVMAFVDWINRPYFEELTQKALRYPDLQDISSHYCYSNPASGLWILEYGDKYVGLIAIDNIQPPEQETEDDDRVRTAVIRHFHVEEMYRSAKPQDDLLHLAVDHAFKNDPKLERIEATDSPLISYLRPCFRVEGFELDHYTQKVGILGWQMGKRYLEREKWSKSK